MKIKIDIHSYKSSHIFNYIVEDLLLVNKTLNDKILNALTGIYNIEEELETERNYIIGDNLEPELLEIYLKKLSNTQIRDFLINGTLLYYYSQFEIKLYNICERLPLLLGCQQIEDFYSKSNKSLDKVSEYLKKFANVDVKAKKYWQNIIDFNDIRNIIAHKEAIQKKDIPKIKSIVSRNSSKLIYNPNSKSIIVKEEYIKEIMTFSFEFIEQIILDIWNKHYLQKT